MTEIISFASSTSRHALPLLVSGQVQKEFFVNEALSRIDLLLHPEIEGIAADPPISPDAGQSWLVADNATGTWTGHSQSIAGWDGQQWTFCRPRRGMRIFDSSNDTALSFTGVWNVVSRPGDPVGGSVVDSEARAAIVAIFDILATLALIPSS